MNGKAFGVVATLWMLTAAPIGVQAQARPDFSGTWTFNGGLTPVESRNGVIFATLTIRQAATELSVEPSSFQQRFPVMVYKLDGSESVSTGPDGVSRTRAAWDGDSLVITGRRTFPGPQGDLSLDVREVYSLANRVLTLERTQTPQGGRPISGKFAFTQGAVTAAPVGARNAQTTPATETFSEGQGAGPRPPAPIARKGAAALCPDTPVEFHACITTTTGKFDLPRARDGKPDLQGYWVSSGGLTGIMPSQGLEATPASTLFGGGNSMVVDPPSGMIPYLPWALKEREFRQRPENALLDPQVHCYNAGVPRQMNIMPFQILRTSDSIVILHEVSHSFRVLHMDGRPHLPASFRTWQGDSLGRWDGDTLVVETTNQNGMTYLDLAHNFLGSNARVTERFFLADPDLLYWTATVEDPAMFTRRWTIGVPMLRQTQKGFEIFESACHEENQDIFFIKRAIDKQKTQ